VKALMMHLRVSIVVADFSLNVDPQPPRPDIAQRDASDSHSWWWHGGNCGTIYEPVAKKKDRSLAGEEEERERA